MRKSNLGTITSLAVAITLPLITACGYLQDQGPYRQGTNPGHAPVEAEPLRAEEPLAMPLGGVLSLTAPSPQELDAIRAPSAGIDREQYAEIHDNPVRTVLEHPVSTFSVDVDTGAYALVRRYLTQGRLPPSDAVRVEELVNYFDYSYPAPPTRNPPFNLVAELSVTPWNPNTHLLQVALKGFQVAKDQRPAANLVFLLDVSGSMDSPDKLPLLKSALNLLVGQLGERDRISIVVYAGASGVVLEPTPGSQKATILEALDRLSAGGSTHGSAGLELAYAMAEQARIPEGINRVLLATDGDFNVGTVNHEQLIDLIERKRSTGISLTTLGFGQGNYNDRLMEQLADHGDGSYAYIDTLNEAQKVLVDGLSSTLETIARDVKIQIEFNPAVVAEYRLIGYENRVMSREDFSNDRVDAGDIGAGHSVTALYEIALVDGGQRRLEPLRYAERRNTDPSRAGNHDEIAFLRLRYKLPESDTSRLIERPVLAGNMIGKLAEPSDDFRFAAAVAAFGQSLRGGRYLEGFSLDDTAELARGARGEDRYDYRGEFLRLVELARALQSGNRGQGPD